VEPIEAPTYLATSERFVDEFDTVTVPYAKSKKEAPESGFEPESEPRQLREKRFAISSFRG